MNEPINIDHESIPEGWVLYRGNYLTQTARSAGVQFRVVERSPGPKTATNKRTNPIPVGVAIRQEDQHRFDAALEKKARRQAHERAAK